MTKAPFTIIHEGNKIKVHKLSITTDIWEMESLYDAHGIQTTRLCIWGADKTNYLCENEVTANITFIARNQRDKKTVILLFGIFTICDVNNIQRTERLFEDLSEYILDLLKEFIADKSVIGLDGSQFIMPLVHYDALKFTHDVHWIHHHQKE